MTDWTNRKMPYEELIAFTTADQKRVYAIARGEASEAAAALDIAADVHECDMEKAAAGKLAARRLYALLGGLLRM